MAKQQLSRYRRDARTRIAAALDALPESASRDDAGKAITAVNPYRERFAGDGLCWASQCWQRERKAALDRRFPQPKEAQSAVTVSYRLGTNWPHIQRTGAGIIRFWWLDVSCGWCRGKAAGGCLQCVGHMARVAAVVEDPTFRALREDARKDPALLPILCDWLAEQGIDVEVTP